MRRTILGLLVGATLVCCGGCVVASSTTKGTFGKAVAVIDDTIYVVDLKEKTASPVAIVEGDEVETIHIEQTETVGSAGPAQTAALGQAVADR